MGKKPYIKPDIREELQILTVRAWVTQTSQSVANRTTQTSYELQQAAEQLTSTSVARLNQVTSTSYFSQILWRIFH